MKKRLLGFLFIVVLFAFSACDSSSSSSSSDVNDDTPACDTTGVIPSKAEESSGSKDADPDSHQGDDGKDKSSSSKKNSHYVCEIYSLSDALKCECNEEREDSLAYNYDSKVELVCIFDEYLNKWGWVEKKEETSSSSKDVESSAGTKPSSSSAKSSSSSSKKVLSSSSYDRTHAFSGKLWRRGDYKTFVDDRDGREYYYLTYVGKDTSGKYDTISVMVENLNVGEMVPGTGDQSDETKIERYCYDNDTLKCMEYGGLYQWAEMMQLPSRCNTESCADQIKPNHQGICPDGWRLLTYNDFYIVVHSKDNPDGVKGVRAGPFGGNNDSGYSLVAAGYKDRKVEFSGITKATYWFYPEESDEGPYFAWAGTQINSSTGMETDWLYKDYGLSVRCVMNKQQAEAPAP